MKRAVVTAGEILVEFVSIEIGCALSKQTRFDGPFPSGAPAIFIDQAARVGAEAMIVGGVGDDGFGRLVCERLHEDGVRLDAVGRHRDRATGVAFVSYFEDGTRTFIFHIENTAAERIDADLGAMLSNETGAGVYLHVSGSSLGNARIRDAVVALAERATASGWEITLDPNVRKELFVDEEARAAVESILSAASIVMPSVEDLEYLLPGRSEDQAIDELLAGGARIVALKRAARGCLVVDGSTRLDLPGHRVQQVDPTGAGDCFCGTFVGLLANGRPVADAARLANAAAALSVTRRGPMEGNAPLAEVEQFLHALEAGTGSGARTA